MNDKFCVYTVLMGDYEHLNEQPTYKDSKTDFICFTDDRNLTSESWKFIYIDPVFPFDFARSSRIPKICPHRFLKEYDVSLYIDNSVILRKAPEAIYIELFEGKNVDFVCFKHSYRETVLDEFIEVAHMQYDDLNTVLEQLNAYHLTDPQVLYEKPLKGAFLLRKHHNQRVVDTMEEWLAHVLRYSRRDQLSLNYAIRKVKPRINALETDFFNSEYFQWPVSSGRDQKKYMRSAFLSTVLMDRISQKEQSIQSLTLQVEELEETVRLLMGSKSWRLTRPLRELAAKVRALRNSK
jgi:hypothetical protein